VRELHEQAVHLPRRSGNERRPRSDAKREAGHHAESDICRADPLALEQVPIHEEPIKEDVEESLFQAVRP
jgi:hypothetical protein